MDYLETKERLEPGTRVNVLGNRLVLIAIASLDEQLADPWQALGSLTENQRLAMAFVDAVPAGLYGKVALQKLDLWDGVEAHVVQTDNVRSALKLVALGEASYGVVYETDTVAEPRVNVLAVFPEDSHPPIVYPAAAISGRLNNAAEEFLTYLHGPVAGHLFKEQGFSLLLE